MPAGIARSIDGRGKGGGIEKRREVRSSCAVGDSCFDMVPIERRRLQLCS